MKPRSTTSAPPPLPTGLSKYKGLQKREEELEGIKSTAESILKQHELKDNLPSKYSFNVELMYDNRTIELYLGLKGTIFLSDLENLQTALREIEEATKYKLQYTEQCCLEEDPRGEGNNLLVIKFTPIIPQQKPNSSGELWQD